MQLISSDAPLPGAAVGPARATTRPGPLAQKVISFDKSMMPTTVCGGSYNQETLQYMLTCQATHINCQFEWPNFGPYGGTTSKLLQVNEQLWPYELKMSACLFVADVVSTLTSNYSNPTLTDTSQNWIAHQWRTQEETLTSIATSASISAGSTSITLSATTSQFIPANSLLVWSNGAMTRTSADAASGSSTISVYPCLALGSGNTCTSYIQGTAFYVFDPQTGRLCLVTDNGANTLNVPNGMASMTSGQTYWLCASYPLTFYGAKFASPNLRDRWRSDPLGRQITSGTPALLKNYISNLVSGQTWPTAYNWTQNYEFQSSADCCYGYFNANIGDNGFRHCAAYGDPV